MKQLTNAGNKFGFQRTKKHSNNFTEDGVSRKAYTKTNIVFLFLNYYQTILITFKQCFFFDVTLEESFSGHMSFD